jgi:hypothetical protein
MDYTESLSFSFRDEEWIKKVGIGGVIGVLVMYTGILIFLSVFAFGYYVAVLRQAASGKADKLPEWNDWGKLFADGISALMIGVVHFVVIGGICAISIVYVANSFFSDGEMAFAIVLISLATLFSLIVFPNLGLVQYAVSGNLGDAFNFGKIFFFLKRELANFLGAAIFSFILNLTLFIMGLGIFSPFTNFWGMIVQAHLFGQCANEARVGEPALHSA